MLDLSRFDSPVLAFAWISSFFAGLWLAQSDCVCVSGGGSIVAGSRTMAARCRFVPDRPDPPGTRSACMSKPGPPVGVQFLSHGEHSKVQSPAFMGSHRARVKNGLLSCSSACYKPILAHAVPLEGAQEATAAGLRQFHRLAPLLAPLSAAAQTVKPVAAGAFPIQNWTKEAELLP